MTASEQSRSTNGGDQSLRAGRVGIVQSEGAVRSGAVEPGGLTAGALIRLAGALDTTVANRIRRVPVRGSSALHPVLDHLREDECLDLLTQGGAARIAFVLTGRLAVQPMQFSLHERKLVSRSEATNPIVRYGDGPVAVEVERLDAADREGWSVLISGRCTVHAWDGAVDEVLVVIEPEHLSGRRVRLW
ncbi:pyridoxamine 5'-phosphate oxidase family protein [Kribbella sp. NPDC050124]|uniref:pyridoxamine 5'-phosphate oxidase family protein n=1 Tax=Kribbella sp. NPDC050124 TaxID=3364114 RepID=UPI00378BA3B2